MSELQAKGEFVPIELTIPIRDPEKNPTPDELEALQVHPSISQAVPIDPVLLESETSSVDFQMYLYIDFCWQYMLRCVASRSR